MRCSASEAKHASACWNREQSQPVVGSKRGSRLGRAATWSKGGSAMRAQERMRISVGRWWLILGRVAGGEWLAWEGRRQDGGRAKGGEED